MASKGSAVVSSIVGFAVCLGITWGLLIYGELPGDIATTNYVSILSSTQYTWVAKVWFLINNILLDTQSALSLIQFIVLAILPWLICGITVGLLSRHVAKGFTLGILAALICIIIGWLIALVSPQIGVTLPTVGIQIPSDPIRYLLFLTSFRALQAVIASGAGGALGGALSPKRE